MSDDVKISDYCLVDHLSFPGPRPPFTPIWILRMGLMYADKMMHFTGVRGAIWRVLGIERGSKNPNICTI